ncbi:Scr1 family TA system antitoxin-like transcriptional regulator [Streptomyces sp. F8]|nr:Scr1 family TA system antitoxin-like transcriptional regulator [Streptomyces sp. F8]MDX6759253.1 Scr1 family TA system antitoxin-like transcriptional regulator [Streptomyces sp. F8]
MYAEQLRHLRACAALPAVSLQVLPLGRTSHAALDGPFTIVETPRPPAPRVHRDPARQPAHPPPR